MQYSFTARAINLVGTGPASAASNPVVPSAVTIDGNISTLVGGWLGDGGSATLGALNAPMDVATDSLGNVYIADRGNNRIRKVTPGGVITTFAGNGTPGFSGDGGLATSAQLTFPSDVATDLQGNVYIADSGNNRIRRVSALGIITTIGGSGVADSSGDGGLATAAGINSPQGVIVRAMVTSMSPSTWGTASDALRQAGPSAPWQGPAAPRSPATMARPSRQP